VLVSAVAGLAFAHLLAVWQVYVASLLFGLVDAFFQPAYTAAVPDLTPPAALPSANALTSLSQQMGRIVGPALAAAIVSAGGTAAAFALDGLSFFISAACLVPLMGLSAPGRASPATSSVLRDVRVAVRTVLASPWLWVTITVSALANVTLGGPYGVALPFLVKEHFHANIGTLGLLYALFAAGYVLGDVWLGGRARLRCRGVLAYGGLLLAGLGLLALGLPIALLGAASAALVNGAALEVHSLSLTNALQELVPREQLGRVASMDMLGSYVLVPVGYGLAGWATDKLGAAPVFVLGGALTAGLALVALAHPQIRRLD
jgi:MFS family permease